MGAVDSYLERLPEADRAALERLRRTIPSVLTNSEEAIRSGVPAFLYKGKPLVSLGAATRHLSLYVMYGDALDAYKEEFSRFDVSNTVVRFTASEPLPDHLVRKLLQHRVAEIDGTDGRRRKVGGA